MADVTFTGLNELGLRPATLLVTLRRYRCTGCGHVWRQDTSKAAEPPAKISRTGLRWALVGIVCQHLSMARIAVLFDDSISTTTISRRRSSTECRCSSPARARSAPGPVTEG